MADKKVSELDAIAAATADDLLYLVDAATTSKKITFANIEASIDHANIANTHNLTTDLTPTWANIVNAPTSSSAAIDLAVTRSHASGADTSLGTGCVALDHSNASAAIVVNMHYATTANAPTASTFPIGTLFVQYTP